MHRSLVRLSSPNVSWHGSYWRMRANELRPFETTWRNRSGSKAACVQERPLASASCGSGCTGQWQENRARTVLVWFVWSLVFQCHWIYFDLSLSIVADPWLFGLSMCFCTWFELLCEEEGTVLPPLGLAVQSYLVLWLAASWCLSCFVASVYLCLLILAEKTKILPLQQYLQWTTH